MKIILKIKIFFLTIFLLNFNSHSEEVGLPLHGFTDVVAGSSNSATPEDQRLRGLSVGTIDLYLTPEFDGGVRSLIEIAFEPNGKDGTTGVDVERLQIGYSLSDTNTLWIGRFHTPYGYWNNAYHHGAQLQTSIYRPRFIDFEDKGGILPAHSVGMWLRGWMSLFDDHRLVYDLYSANGPQSLERQALGIRYNVNEKAALKFEYLRTQQKEDSPDNITFDSWVAQYSIRF